MVLMPLTYFTRKETFASLAKPLPTLLPIWRQNYNTGSVKPTLFYTINIYIKGVALRVILTKPNINGNSEKYVYIY